jgi:nicotinate-nucleotide pyrophosphorylase (carboxylating)
MDGYVKSLIEQALKEDILTGDITTENTIPKNKKGKGEILLKEDGVIAGLDIVKEVFFQIDPKVKLQFNVKDGIFKKKETVIGDISGSLHSILLGERIALNFLQRISGIATYTKKYIDIVKKSGKNIKIVDTRKTTPNFRYFEKLGVRLGGGYNHRIGLYDAVMIKDNHIIATGGIRNAVNLISKHLGHTTKIEIEVKTIEQLKEVLQLSNYVDIVMLDNFTPGKCKKAIEIIGNRKITVEISGGIDLSNIQSYLLDGIDVISIGGLTHSYRSLDISLNFINL